MSPPDTPAPPPPSAFPTLLSASEDGRLLDDLNEQLTKLVGAMRNEQLARGGRPKGSLTLGFSFQLDNNGIMEVVASVATKEPKAERSRSIFYAVQNNTLSPNNPEQLTMDLGTPREVPAPQMKVM